MQLVYVSANASVSLCVIVKPQTSEVFVPSFLSDVCSARLEAEIIGFNLLARSSAAPSALSWAEPSHLMSVTVVGGPAFSCLSTGLAPPSPSPSDCCCFPELLLLLLQSLSDFYKPFVGRVLITTMAATGSSAWKGQAANRPGWVVSERASEG